MSDARFERDLREILQEMAPVDAPAALRNNVQSIPAASTRRAPRLVVAALGLAAAAVLVVAVVAAGTLSGLFDGMPGVGGEPTQSAVATAPSVRLTYQVLPDGAASVTADDLAETARIMQQRLAATGIAAISATPSGPDRVEVVVAIDSADEATLAAVRELAGTRGRFALVPTGAAEVRRGDEIDLAAQAPLWEQDDEVESAAGGTSESGLTLTIRFTPAGARALETWSTEHAGEYLALVVDGTVAVGAQVREPLAADMELSLAPEGAPDVQALAAILNSGPLPFAVEEVALETLP